MEKWPEIEIRHCAEFAVPDLKSGERWPRPLPIPTWISGPEPGDKDSGEDKSIQVMMKYRNAQGETGIIDLTFWTPMSGQETSLPPGQQVSIAPAEPAIARYD
jgi:hypothetical protein